MKLRDSGRNWPWSPAPSARESLLGYPTLGEVARSLELAAKAQDAGGAAAALAGIKEVCAASW
jgi:hypothetical protein